MQQARLESFLRIPSFNGRLLLELQMYVLPFTFHSRLHSTFERYDFPKLLLNEVDTWIKN